MLTWMEHKNGEASETDCNPLSTVTCTPMKQCANWLASYKNEGITHPVGRTRLPPTNSEEMMCHWVPSGFWSKSKTLISFCTNSSVPCCTNTSQYKVALPALFTLSTCVRLGGDCAKPLTEPSTQVHRVTRDKRK